MALSEKFRVFSAAALTQEWMQVVKIHIADAPLKINK